MRSEARSLLSMARFNIVKSLRRPFSSKGARIVSTSGSLKGRFCPINFPLFQGVYSISKGIAEHVMVPSTDAPIGYEVEQHSLSQRDNARVAQSMSHRDIN